MLPTLSTDEIQRYSRHLLLPQIGLEGQRRLKAARILLVGAGGLGSPAALYLAAAGIGHLTLVEFDVVDVTNLQRQVLHGTRDVGRPKAHSARDRLLDLNPHLSLDLVPDRLTARNALALVRGHDLVVDGTDNFATRYLVNDACVIAGRPDVQASIHRFDGQASVFAAPGGPCYRCLFPTPPPPGEIPSCAEAGVLGVLPGLLGTIQATEAIKLAARIGDPLVGRLLLVDALAMRFRSVTIRPDPGCRACGTREILEPVEETPACEAPAADPVPEITPAELHTRLGREDAPALIDVREPQEWEVSRLPGARLAPLSRLDDEMAGLDPGRELVVYCRSGVRSQEAGRRLRAAGFTRVRSLAGGILRYGMDVDPSLPRD